MEEGRQRLAKVLAARGVASRREAERLIAEGLVSVNGEVIRNPAHGVTEADKLRLDGKFIPLLGKRVYYLLYKPKGYITSRDDPQGRRSVLELLPDVAERVEPVGRLDINTEGAILLTNDGDLAHRLTHPSTNVPKRYLAKVWKVPSERTLQRIQDGVMLEDGKTAPCKARVMKTTDEAGNCWVEITVTEGRNRLVRRIFATMGHPVSKLRRESFATISIRGLERGQYRTLTNEEVARLQEVAGGVPATHAGKKPGKGKVGFAKPSEAWLKRRVDKGHRKDKRSLPPRGGAAR